MSDVVIRTENLGKRYRIGERERYLALRDVLTRAASAPARLFRPRKASSSNGAHSNGNLSNGNHSNGAHNHNGDQSHIWALKDVSFEIRQGEVVGIIGCNGAGKSTLLKILARVTKPTQGFVEVHGRMGTLLEVGTGFHPELTGRENVFLSGAILGMSKTEIRRKFDEIVAFSEVEKFIDTPLKHYSSGMQMRLAFAVAAHLEPEILLVDEVLAVGDLEFQRKCLGKMGEVARTGRTVLFVSHNIAAITRLCPRTVWLDGGQITADAPSRRVVDDYQARYFAKPTNWSRRLQADDEGQVRFIDASVTDAAGVSRNVFSGDEQVTIELRYRVSQPLLACQIGARVCSQDETVIFTTTDADGTGYSALAKQPGTYSASFQVPKGLLAPGTYFVLLAAHLPQRDLYDVVEHAVSFEVANVGSLASIDGRLGVVTPLLAWRTMKERLVGGVGTSPALARLQHEES